jgi:hypothetical protein
VEDDERIRATVPEGAVKGKVRVTSSAGSAESAGDFTPGTFVEVVSLPPAHDATVDSSSPAQNYGELLSLVCVTDGSIRRAYLKFEVADLDGAVLRAALRLWVEEGGGDAGAAAYAVPNDYEDASSAWTETGLVWENAPSVAGLPLAFFGDANPDAWVELDVSTAVTGGGTYSFALRNPSPVELVLASREGARPPRLVVELLPEGGPPPVSTAAGPAGALPGEFSLGQSRPNPAFDSAAIPFALPRPAHVELTIHDVLGRRVRTILDAPCPAGYHVIRWDGRNEAGSRVASSTYFYTLRAGSFEAHRKILIRR